MEPDPYNKGVIDYLVTKQEQKRSRRAWIVFVLILGVSLTLLYLFNHGVVSGVLGNILALVGIAGVVLFLGFLSTKPFGHSDTSFRWWWFR